MTFEYDPGTLYEFAVIEGDGSFRPLLMQRYMKQEEAYFKLDELSKIVELKQDEELAFTIVPDS